MSILIAIDPHAASLRRFECSGTKSKLTHEFEIPGPVTFQQNIIDEMRFSPPDHLKVEPPPRPTNSPAGAGTASLARAA